MHPRGVVARLALLAPLALLAGCASPMGAEDLAMMPGLVHSLIEAGTCGRDSVHPKSPSDVAAGHEDALKRIRLGIVKNPNRARWSSPIDKEDVDEREDENLMLAEYAKETGLFGDVVVVDSIAKGQADYLVSCSVDCTYYLRADGWGYACNIFPWCMGGFLFGLPYRDSTALYVGQAEFYDCRGEAPELVAGSLASNFKKWSAISLYTKPNYYGMRCMRPIFDQILDDFIVKSGALGAPSCPAEEGK